MKYGDDLARLIEAGQTLCIAMQCKCDPESIEEEFKEFSRISWVEEKPTRHDGLICSHSRRKEYASEGNYLIGGQTDERRQL